MNIYGGGLDLYVSDDRDPSESFPFFAFLSRMKYIQRWALMRNTENENLCQHSFEVSVIAHALALIGNRLFEKHYDPGRAAVLALFHDAPEIFSGDMPTPAKYFTDEIKTAYSSLEGASTAKLINSLPEELKKDYTDLIRTSRRDAELRKLVKAADKISALIKCEEELKVGNREFAGAYDSTLKKIEALGLPEVKYFMDNFFDAYSRNLDQLQ